MSHTQPPKVPQAYLDRLVQMLQNGNRVMLGLVGCPGAGKSTLALALQQRFGDISQVVPMDGFHLANVELQRLGRAARKGAPDTFDGAGYVALLHRIRQQRVGETIYAPEFRREIEEPIAGAIAIKSETRLIIAEGNYLLLDTMPWHDIKGILDETWYVEIDPGLRTDRLLGRHQDFGRSREAALDWIASTDEPNARLIAQTRPRANCLFSWED